ncbi:MAG: FkbM family methyltransferase [Bacteroidetes bacterium]|nr:FkbM family methyltransferase [Bacteroidota bacterium]MBS1736021.1 FkbM family methyltransferase [Bacteroidota bacterium]
MIEEIIRKIVKEELIHHKNYSHTPFAVYMGDGTVLTKSFYDVMYLVSSYDCTMAPHFIIHGVYESELTKYFLNNVKEDSVFVDVGANFGYYSCLMAKRINGSKGGRVFSFEANINAFVLLQKNMMANWVDQGAVSLNHIAISDKEEEVSFKSYKYRFGGSQFYTTAEDEQLINTMEVLKVKTKTLDSYLANHRVDFIKIDVEGAEFKVLRGAEGIIRNNPSVKILLEWDNGQFSGQGVNISDLVNFLRTRNLKPSKLNWEDGSTSDTSYDYLLSTHDHLCGVLFTR